MTPEFTADVELDATIQAHGPPRPSNSPERVFLTGATGFLGSYLLRELQGRGCQVWCLVRAKNDEHARGRLTEALARHELGPDSFEDRIVAVAGDLSRPRFGLSDETYDRVSRETDFVLHNGALVNFVYGYPYLRAANVGGTVEALRLATTNRLKRFHYVSSVTLFRAAAPNQIAREDVELDSLRGQTNGYGQTKWVSERLVGIASSRGVPTTISRPGYVSGDTVTGVSPVDDSRLRMLQACVDLHIAPRSETRLDMMPVDILSRHMITVAMDPRSSGRTFHFHNPRTLPWTELVQGARSFGFDVELLPMAEWRARLDLSAAPPNRYAARLSDAQRAFLSRSTAYRWLEATELRVDCSNTLGLLNDRVPDYPAITPSLLNKYFEYYVRRNILKSPEAQRSLRD